MTKIELVQQAIAYIEKNLYSQLTVFDVARAVSYFYTHFQRVFFRLQVRPLVNIFEQDD